MNNKVIEKINERLLSLPQAKLAQGNRWIILRCKYCGDSHNLTHAHFGIHIPQHENDIYYYNCFKCHASGKLSTDTLFVFGIYDIEVIEGLSKWNKRVLSKPENRMFRDQVFMINNTYISNNKLSLAKLNYINNRLGTNMTYKDILDNKIVLNLYDMMKDNNINKFTRDKRILDQLNGGFIGFLSQDNAFVNMRRVVSEEKVVKSLQKRYVNYNLFNKFDNNQKYFTLPNVIRLDNPKRIKLKIAEGPFDILSIYYNLENEDKNNCIYTSITGSGYIQILEFFIVKKRLMNIEVHIYIDNDIKSYILSNIIELLYTLQIPLYIHQNTFPGEKDFGVRKEKIIDTIIN